MGLPSTSLPALYLAVQAKGPYSAVAGLTPAIKAAVQGPWQEAFIAAGSTVFLVSAAFSGTAVILSLLFKDNDKATANFVASNVHGRVEGKEYQAELTQQRRASLGEAESPNGKPAPLHEQHAGEKY